MISTPDIKLNVSKAPKILEEAAEFIQQNYPLVEAAILYGSLATGKAHEYSDIDICLYQTGEVSYMELHQLERLLGEQFQVPFDLNYYSSIAKLPLALGTVVMKGQILFDKTGVWSKILANKKQIVAAYKDKIKELQQDHIIYV